MGRGVPAGAYAATQIGSSKPLKPCSPKVGTSGIAADRDGPVMPSAFSLPPCTCGLAPTGLAKVTSRLPPMTSVIAGCLALVRHVVRLMPWSLARISP